MASSVMNLTDVHAVTLSTMFLITVSGLILPSASGTAFAQEQQNQTSAATLGNDTNTTTQQQ